jgi:rifampicin phosphotransferase
MVSDLVGSRPPTHTPRRSVKQLLTYPVWLITRRALAVREEHRHECMRAFHSTRKALVNSAERATERGQLRSVNDLWLLSVDEANKLDTGWIPTLEFWEEREAERTLLSELDPPDLVHRFDDPSLWAMSVNTESIDESPTANRWSGIPLTSGTVSGTAWVIGEPTRDLPTELTGPVILVARSIDAAWSITFPLVVGVAVETGGDLSHGSIVLRELGKPAITNARQAFRQVRTGDRVELRADQGVLVRQR